MKYIFVDLAQLICWALLAKYSFDWWDSSKNDEGVYAFIAIILGSSVIYFFGRRIVRAFKKEGAVIGEYTLIADDYTEMRRRFRDDKRRL